MFERDVREQGWKTESYPYKFFKGTVVNNQSRKSHRPSGFEILISPSGIWYHLTDTHSIWGIPECHL